MKQNVIVLGAKGWAMIDERTQQQREGVSIHYIASDNLKACVDSVTGLEGYQPTKQSISIEEAKHLESVPGVYEADFALRPSGGKTILVIDTLKYVGPVKG